VDEAVSFTAVVLAGERTTPAADPLASAAGVVSKVLVPIVGVPVLERVLNSIEQSPTVTRRMLVGPTARTLAAAPGIAARIESGAWTWIAPTEGPAASATAAFDAIGTDGRIVLTTADHAFLTPAILEYFCRQSLATGADFTVGLARRADVAAKFPHTRRTGWHFSDDTYCGCNLFAVLKPAGHSVTGFWRHVEKERKRPWRILRTLGVGLFARYLVGRLSLHDALAEVGRRTQCRIAPVLLPYAEAAVDVDSIDDWRLVNETWPRLRG
jgi:CTP:molybdopterin cytidylyltransferase MocA